MESNVEAQLEALQTELAFQGDALHALSEAFADQQRELLRLREQMQLLLARLAEQRESAAADTAPEPRPPHY